MVRRHPLPLEAARFTAGEGQRPAGRAGGAAGRARPPIRDRFDNAKRNAWNEFERGPSYTRSKVVAYSLIPTFSGFEYHMAYDRIGFDPLQASADGCRTIWSLDSGCSTIRNGAGATQPHRAGRRVGRGKHVRSRRLRGVPFGSSAPPVAGQGGPRPALQTPRYAQLAPIRRRRAAMHPLDPVVATCLGTARRGTSALSVTTKELMTYLRSLREE